MATAISVHMVNRRSNCLLCEGRVTTVPPLIRERTRRRDSHCYGRFYRTLCLQERCIFSQSSTINGVRTARKPGVAIGEFILGFQAGLRDTRAHLDRRRQHLRNRSVNIQAGRPKVWVSSRLQDTYRWHYSCNCLRPRWIYRYLHPRGSKDASSNSNPCGTPSRSLSAGVDLRQVLKYSSRGSGTDQIK